METKPQASHEIERWATKVGRGGHFERSREDYDFVLEAGEVIDVPYGWCHRVETPQYPRRGGASVGGLFTHAAELRGRV